eukprot:3662467-Amphidinium_carterae.1
MNFHRHEVTVLLAPVCAAKKIGVRFRDSGLGRSAAHLIDHNLLSPKVSALPTCTIVAARLSWCGGRPPSRSGRRPIYFVFKSHAPQ